MNVVEKKEKIMLGLELVSERFVVPVIEQFLYIGRAIENFPAQLDVWDSPFVTIIL